MRFRLVQKRDTVKYKKIFFFYFNFSSTESLDKGKMCGNFKCCKFDIIFFTQNHKKIV